MYMISVIQCEMKIKLNSDFQYFTKKNKKQTDIIFLAPVEWMTVIQFDFFWLWTAQDVTPCDVTLTFE